MSAESLLVLGAAAVQEDAVRAAQRLGLHVIVCARAADGPAAVSGDELRPDQHRRRRRPRGPHARTRPTGCVYSVGSDLAMPVVGALGERLSAPVLAPSESMLRRATTRRECGARCRACREHWRSRKITADDPVERTVPLPCIVKPVDAQGQRGVALVTDDAHCADAWRTAARPHSRTGGVIVERFVGGTEISVNGYVVDGALVFVQASDRVVWPQFTGLIRKHVVPSAVLDNDAVAAHAVTELLQAVCERVGLTQGPVYAQMKVEDGTPHIIELTPRLDGCHMWQLDGSLSSRESTCSRQHFVTWRSGRPPRISDGARPVTPYGVGVRLSGTRDTRPGDPPRSADDLPATGPTILPERRSDE